MKGQNPRWSKPDACRGCALEHNGFGFAPPSGPPGARLTFVGEALGYEEAIAGEPFWGSAGGVLSRICIRAGVTRAHCRIANVVSCRPPQDYLAGAPWEHLAIQQCRTYLLPVLAQVPDGGVVVTLGAVALNAVLQLTGQKGITVKDFHGTVHRVDREDGTGYWVVPTFHPSHLQRGAMNLLEVVTQDLMRAHRIALKGFTRSQSQLVVDPTPEWFDWWVSDHLARVAQDRDQVHLSLDSEFPEKVAGGDEGELLDWNAQTPMTRVNGGNDPITGWSVPYLGAYIPIVEKLLGGVAKLGGWAWLWNKYADWDHFRAAGHSIDGIEAIDGMWVWHHIQSDVPRGLGFVAPMASDFGAWKHWSHTESKFGAYAAADGVQNWRTCMWVMKAAIQLGMWDMFMRDWHDRDFHVLRPAYVMGVPINRQELENFHAENQKKLASVLVRLQETAAKGVLKPKLGYARKPKLETPPASIMGKPKKGGAEAKTEYMKEGVRLVEKEVDVDVRICTTCGAEDVGPKHQCPKPKATRRPTTRRKSRTAAGDQAVGDADGRGADSDSALSDSADRLAPSSDDGHVRPIAALVTTTRRRSRWFWQLPFNPDAPAQVLAYLAQQGIAAPIDKKKQKATTNKKALQDLAKQHRDNPFFQLQLDWKAVQKVDAVYAVGTMALLDRDNRVHPEYLPIPSTLRDSARKPNLTNVVADKAGVQGLASGFRRVIEARDGVPMGVTVEELERWGNKWIIGTTQ